MKDQGMRDAHFIFPRAAVRAGRVICVIVLAVVATACWQAAAPEITAEPNASPGARSSAAGPRLPTATPFEPAPASTQTAVLPLPSAAPAETPGTKGMALQPLLAKPQVSIGQWQLVWNDEFDGSTLDRSKWKIFIWKRAADINKTWYTADNILVSDGTLKLYVRNEARGNANYTGGMVEADGNYQRNRYGYFEARIRYDFNGPGFWGNFWMTGSDHWPPEFDNEVVTQTSHQNEVYQAHHYLDFAGEHVSSNTFISLDYREWHVYGIKWLPCQPVEFYIDGQRTFTSGATLDNPPSVDMDLVLRAGAFQNEKWGGLPDDTTRWPGVVEYDWVRVYRWTGKADGCGG